MLLSITLTILLHDNLYTTVASTIDCSSNYTSEQSPYFIIIKVVWLFDCNYQSHNLILHFNILDLSHRWDAVGRQIITVVMVSIGWSWSSRVQRCLVVNCSRVIIKILMNVHIHIGTSSTQFSCFLASLCQQLSQVARVHNQLKLLNTDPGWDVQRMHMNKSRRPQGCDFCRPYRSCSPCSPVIVVKCSQL